jgi:hypothetical protein
MIRAAKAQQIDDPKARDTCHSRGGPPVPTAPQLRMCSWTLTGHTVEVNQGIEWAPARTGAPVPQSRGGRCYGNVTAGTMQNLVTSPAVRAAHRTTLRRRKAIPAICPEPPAAASPREVRSRASRHLPPMPSSVVSPFICLCPSPHHITDQIRAAADTSLLSKRFNACREVGVRRPPCRQLRRAYLTCRCSPGCSSVPCPRRFGRLACPTPDRPCRRYRSGCRPIGGTCRRR